MMLIICEINFISKCVERINEALIQIHTDILYHELMALI